MARFSDYIMAFEEDDGNPEGTGVIVIERLRVSGHGTDGNYGRIRLSLSVNATGANVSKASVTLPKLSVYGFSGNKGKVTLPKLQISATRILFGTGLIPLKLLEIHGSGLEQGSGNATLSLPMIQITGWAGPPVKLFELCQDSNWGL